MNEQALFALLFLVIFLVLVIATYWLYEFLGFTNGQSRKFLHVTGGLLALCLPQAFEDHWWVLLLCSIAFVLLLITYLKKWLPAVHETRRRSIGSVVYPIPVYLCFLMADYYQHDLFFYLPVAFLTIPDTIAEWSGNKWGLEGKGLFQNGKTFAGSAGFAISALLIAVAFGIYFNISADEIMVLALATTLAATMVEAASTLGWDNLTVPVATAAVLLFLYNKNLFH